MVSPEIFNFSPQPFREEAPQSLLERALRVLLLRHHLPWADVASEAALMKAVVLHEKRPAFPTSLGSSAHLQGGPARRASARRPGPCQ